MAAGILGGRLAGRPLTVRQGLARSRMVFWRAVVASIVAGVPLALLQGAVEAVLADVFDMTGEVTVAVSIVVTALFGAPLAYMLAGVVLGDVDPFEALRRSIRVFRARKIAAIVVALVETSTGLLILFGLGAGLDIALRLLDALGLGASSGPAGPDPGHDRHRGRDVRPRNADLHGHGHRARATGRDVRGADPRDDRARPCPARAAIAPRIVGDPAGPPSGCSGAGCCSRS